MMDAANSDDERYANESFENESDTEVPEMSEFESEATENSDDDDDDNDDDDEENLPSVKANTKESIMIKTSAKNYMRIKNTDVVPFASSSEEEDEVIVGQTLAEINTRSMLFEEVSTTSISQFFDLEGDNKKGSVEINEEDEDGEQEEEDEEEELKNIQLMEEKYLQQIAAEFKTETEIEQTEKLIKQQQPNSKENQKDCEEAVNEADTENKKLVEEPVSEYEDENASGEEYCEENIQTICRYETSCSSLSQNVSSVEAGETLAQTQLVQIIKTSLTNLRILSPDDNETRCRSPATPIMETKPQTAEKTSNNIDAQEIALAVVSALKSAGIDSLNKSPIPLEELKPTATEKIDEHNNKTKGLETNEANQTEIVEYKDDFEEEKEIEVEKPQDSCQKDNNQDIFYDDDRFDYRITSKTPTSFNSDDYIFHANFIKTIYRTDAVDKLRAKPHPRKSMSFSNERMREIDRHNQILLRKILTQKPTYNLKSKPSQSTVQKLPSQTNGRLTTSALNRKKQQRQIELDNQVLKRKIVAIALRRHPFIT